MNALAESLGTEVKRSPSLINLVMSDGPPTILIEAHDGLSALIVERSGGAGIWASGLAISTALGVRDCSEVTYTQTLDLVLSMRSATDLPILIDADTGFGSVDALKCMVRRAHLIGAGGICIEDKLFPKHNSFLSVDHVLASVEEQCRRLRAVREVTHTEFALIARTESLIAGAGMDEALLRACHYMDAGASAIFIHSRQDDASEIVEFARRWKRRAPLVVAPTTYPSVSIDQLGELGVTIVIAANQMIRAALGAMETTARRIIEKRSLMVELPSVGRIFSLLNYPGAKA